ncbi:MAG: Zeta toxin family protein [Planctomycetota bacterium]|nr:MAG: Zeta toxin family protein [Planctomycetota bacterium]
MMAVTPQVVVIAGPNGAGKTSAAPELLRDAVGIDAFVNADVIAAGLSGFSPESAAFEAGRIMLRRLEELARNREDLAFESTLAGLATYRFLTKLVKNGYDCHIYYLWLPSPELAIARVRERVQAGGHDVPEPTIRRRFRRSLVNFDRLYRPLATTWRLYDGGVPGDRPLIAHGKGAGRPVVLNEATWQQIRKQVEESA